MPVRILRFSGGNDKGMSNPRNCSQSTLKADSEKAWAGDAKKQPASLSKGRRGWE